MSAREYGDKVVAMEGDRQITYSELDDKSNRIACWLRKSGVQPGERGIIYMPNNIEYYYLLFGMFKAGVIPIPLNYRFQKEEIRYVLTDSGASLMFVLERNTPIANELEKEVPTLERVVVSDEGASGSNALFLKDVLKGYDPDPDVFPALDDDLAMIMYTSGTTGKPKGVKQTHRNNVANANVFAFTQQVTSKDRLLCATPLFHVGGMIPSFTTIFTGGSVVFLPMWDATRFLELVGQKKVTWTFLVGLMGAQLAGMEGIDKYDLSSLKYVIFGGSPISEAIYKNFQKKFNIMTYELYGRTEHVGVSVCYDVTDTRVPGSAGKLLGQVIKGKFADPQTGKAVGIGEPGELMVKGDILTPGYWNKPEENAKLFDGEGWQHTGDVFTRDKQGYLFFMERTDDMIISGGENIYPREIESVLYNHPGVAEVAVIGLPHEEWGAQVAAVIVKKDPKLAEEEIVAFLKERKDLSGYKRPRIIKLVDQIPKTASQKIDKASLKKLYS
jgi:long-chain acyl-CoA synthetase